MINSVGRLKSGGLPPHTMAETVNDGVSDNSPYLCHVIAISMSLTNESVSGDDNIEST